MQRKTDLLLNTLSTKFYARLTYLLKKFTTHKKSFSQVFTLA